MKRKTLRLLLMSTLLGNCCFGQIKVTNINKDAVPKTIKYIGKIINAATYTDKSGQYLVITTETGETVSKDKETGGRDAALYAYHYDISTPNNKLTWQTQDFIKDCPVDIYANFLPKTFAITDLDNNGIAEVWLMYKTICHGDVSPSNMKIIMHEGDKKYAVRGENKVKVSATEYEGGKYTFDDAFNKAPQIFRQYALQLWNKNLMETWN